MIIFRLTALRTSLMQERSPMKACCAGKSIAVMMPNRKLRRNASYSAVMRTAPIRG